MGFLLAVGAAAATMLGWAAVAAKRTWTPRAMGMALLASAVAMLAISAVELVPPGIRDPQTRATSLLLLALGVALVPLLHSILSRLMPRLAAAQGTALMVAVSVGLHNVPEGSVAIAATLVSVQAGIVTAVAIALHNIPEGMAVATAVLAAGGGRRRALHLTGVSMGGEILGALAVLALGASMGPTAAAGLLCLVGGVMISLSLTELIPAAVTLLRTHPELVVDHAPRAPAPRAPA